MVSQPDGAVDEQTMGQDGGGSDLIVCAIVLAAGRASRMGEQKLLLPLEGRTLVEWVADTALGARVTETIVVAGYEAEAVRAVLGDRPLRVVVNPDYAQGMSTSLRAGARAARNDCDAVVFLLGDQPFVTSAMVDALVSRFRETGALIVRPEIAGRPGHPVLMSKALIPEILEQVGDIGGRELAERHRDRQIIIPWGGSQQSFDIDTAQDYETALGYLEARATS